MAAPPICRNCGSALPRAALFCPRCKQPVFLFGGRRARRLRDASLLGVAGSLLMGIQAAFMFVGGAIALVALNQAVGGDLGGAERTVGVAAVFVGLTLLFDLVGITLLAIAFYAHQKAARAAAITEAADAGRRRVAFDGFLATLLLVLWLLVTLAWRVALAALVSFYPTPLGLDLSGVAASDLRRAAAVMLGLWVAAAFLLFLAAVFGTRFLARVRGVPISLRRLFWPLETLLHACTALGIAILAQSLLARPRFEVSTLALVQAFGALDLLVVPSLGLLAYLVLFRDFLGFFREARAAAPPPAPVPAADPPGES